jgi:GNAT superfamily N-acetyltransferase
MRVREAQLQDVPAIAQTLVDVAPEGVLGVEPPIDAEARAERHRATLCEPGSGGAWLLEGDDGEQLGHLCALDGRPGLLSIGMALLPAASGRGGGRMLLERAIAHGRAVGAHKLTLESGPTTTVRSRCTPRPGSKSRGCCATTIAAATAVCAAA